MSSDIASTKTEYIGVRVPKQIADKIKDRVSEVGGTRQDVIRQVLIKEFF